MSKKTETIEFRVAPEEKQRLVTASNAVGLSLSEYIRDQLAQDVAMNTAGAHLHRAPHDWRRKVKQVSRPLALMAVTLLGSAAIWALVDKPPALAQAELRAWFAEMDADANGTVSPGEYAIAETRSLVAERDEITELATIAGCADDAAALMAEYDMEMRERQTDLPDEFRDLDHDNNGALAFQELQAMYHMDQLAAFHEIDHNLDGVVTMAEYRMMVTQEFGTEADDDYYAAFSPACADALRAMDQADAAAYPDDMEIMIRTEFASYDANRDQRISQGEFLTY
ncbi:MAG: EF-hand domain-containing protein [Pseudomonadota bacterium]